MIKGVTWTNYSPNLLELSAAQGSRRHLKILCFRDYNFWVFFLSVTPYFFLMTDFFLLLFHWLHHIKYSGAEVQTPPPKCSPELLLHLRRKQELYHRILIISKWIILYSHFMVTHQIKQPSEHLNVGSTLFQRRCWNNVDPTLKTKQNPTSDFQRCTTLIQRQCPTLKQRCINVVST